MPRSRFPSSTFQMEPVSSEPQPMAAPTLVGRLVQGLGFYLLLLLLGGVSLAWNLVCWPLWLLLPRRRGQAIGRAGVSTVYRGCWVAAGWMGLMRIDADALDVLNHEPGGLVIAANHPSMLDALLIVARLRRGVCIMKGALMRNVFLGAGARLARYIRNDSPRKMVRHAIASLREGGQLVVFPEGTRSDGPRLNAFRPGFTLIAHKAGVPIQTVIIETDSPFLTKGWPIWLLPPLPMTYRLRLGERFEAGPDPTATLAQLESYFRKEIGL